MTLQQRNWLRERLARTLAELHGAADTTREPLYTDDADAALAALGLDDFDSTPTLPLKGVRDG